MFVCKYLEKKDLERLLLYLKKVINLKLIQFNSFSSFVHLFESGGNAHRDNSALDFNSFITHYDYSHFYV